MISATIPKNFITFLKKKWGYDCGRYINLITSDPLAKIFNTSTSFKERDRIMDYVVVSMKNFLQRDVNDIALVYFENKIIQENYYRRLCSEFGDKLMVMINADTDNKQASLLRLTRGARVLLVTKSVTCCIDLPQVNHILFINCLVPVIDFLQVTGRGRGSCILNILYQDSEAIHDSSDYRPCEERIRVSKCLTKQVAHFYGIKVSKCQNCCDSNDSILEPHIVDLVKNVHYATETQFKELQFGTEQAPARKKFRSCTAEEKLDHFALQFEPEEWLEELIDNGAKYLKYPLTHMDASPESEYICTKCYRKHGKECNRGGFKALLVLKWILDDITYDDIKDMKVNGWGDEIYKWAQNHNLKHLYRTYLDKVEQFRNCLQVPSAYLVEGYGTRLDHLRKFLRHPFFLNEYLLEDPIPTEDAGIYEKAQRYGEEYMHADTRKLIQMSQFHNNYCRQCGNSKHSGECRYSQAIELFYIIFCIPAFRDLRRSRQLGLTINYFPHWLDAISKNGHHICILNDILGRDRVWD
ncbi:uncharacterized protein SPAPADRAFT_65737 [Spathaspora passalidarum NRRL Y-27907]|uniref:Helicase C-terminal domain-containing protein n=1 Tax=Spathaspora passalidarum (strain NRRL Y-27907 / 11-Y1) TaxID=619300 RepID=G3ALS7_SPAPN|nr:uncharacterized protein SPAPADRAFT_65737 [Spathaspora passalidarum NRRL Y-27907]EGW32686.1 hypothetical protein SPAPADRAFT_65737 [Spathaspora passalidarum NRRL Y-27907]